MLLIVHTIGRAADTRGISSISMNEPQSLHTADWWLDEQGTYFERVPGADVSAALADNSFDWVFCCEALHHNDRRSMNRVPKEIHRVLRPGGSRLVMNEPLRRLTDLERDHGTEVARFAGNEHVRFFPEYLWMAKRAGFQRIRVTERIEAQPNTLYIAIGDGLVGHLGRSAHVPVHELDREPDR